MLAAVDLAIDAEDEEVDVGLLSPRHLLRLLARRPTDEAGVIAAGLLEVTVAATLATSSRGLAGGRRLGRRRLGGGGGCAGHVLELMW